MKKHRNLVIAFSSLLLAMLTAFTGVVLILLPVYEATDKALQNVISTAEADEKLKRAENLIDIMNIAVAVFMTIFVVFIILEIVQASKKKKHGK